MYVRMYVMYACMLCYVWVLCNVCVLCEVMYVMICAYTRMLCMSLCMHVHA